MAAKKTTRVARISPSNSGHWLNCPGWAQATYGIGDEADPLGAAAQGTAAHTLFQMCGVFGANADDFMGAEIGAFTVDDDMADAVQAMLDWIAQWLKMIDSSMMRNEMPLKGKFAWFVMDGTADLVHWNPTTMTLTVVDYKHGSGRWVDADSNTQIGLYVIMAIQTLGVKPKHVFGVVGQPRAERTGSELIREYKWTDKEINQLKERATQAIIEAHTPGSPRRAGTHCDWCAAAPTCKELAEYCLRTAMSEFKSIEDRPMIEPSNPENLTPDALAYIQDQAPIISAWLRSVQYEIQRRLTRHSTVAGYKLVAGRTHRKWISEASVLKALKAYKVDTEGFIEHKVLSPLQVEKRLKKIVHTVKLDERIKSLITKSNPPLHVVPESDPRPPLVGTASLDFTPVGEQDE